MMKPLCIAVALLACAANASAHVVLAETQAAPGAYYVGAFRVGHGCGSSPTTAVRVEIPDGIYIARPRPKPGWTLEIERTPLAAPISLEGGQITDRVSAITWRGQLGADQFDEFAIMLKLPEGEGPLYFPTIQTCFEGERRWTDIAPGQAWHAVPRPAPVLHIAAPTEAIHDHH